MSELSFAFGFAQPHQRLIQLPESETVRTAPQARQLSPGLRLPAIGRRQFHGCKIPGGNEIASRRSSAWANSTAETRWTQSRSRIRGLRVYRVSAVPFGPALWLPHCRVVSTLSQSFVHRRKLFRWRVNRRDAMDAEQTPNSRPPRLSRLCGSIWAGSLVAALPALCPSVVKMILFRR